MIVEIKVGSSTVDITGFLDNESDLLLSQELERDVFERTVDDVHLRASNLTGLFTNIFSPVLATTKVELRVVSDANRVLFIGFVKLTTVRFDVKGEWVGFDTFSLTRAMWDFMAGAEIGVLFPVPPPIPLSQEFISLYATLSYLFLRSNLLSQGIIVGLDLGVYTNRSIRAYLDSTVYGNEGRLRELNPEMTLKELHEAMAIYYNAEFFVDAATRTWKMVKRNSPLVAVATSIDYAIRDDEKIQVQWIDENKKDYIYTFSLVNRNPPELVRTLEVTTVDITRGQHYYIITDIVDDVEVVKSDPPLGVYVWTTAENSFFRIEVSIPPSIDGTTRRCLYRFDVNNAYGLGYRRVQIIEGNAATTHVDRRSHTEFGSLIPIPVISNKHSAWIGYDEASSAWRAPILDIFGGTNRPVGEIFDVRPRMQFTTIGQPGELQPYNPAHVLKFFASDNTIENIHEQFLEMFLTKRKALVPVVGTDFKLGDVYTSQLISNTGGLSNRTQYLVKKATNNLTKEESKLEMIPT